MTRVGRMLRSRGIRGSVGRVFQHAWNIATRSDDARYSWQVLTNTLPKLDIVNIEITTFCNLRCAGCERTIYSAKGAWNNQHLSVDDFRRLVSEVPTAYEFIPQGIGEPALHPQLPTLIEIAAESRKFNEISITTHGMARDEDYYSSLFDAGLTRLYVSVDTLDPELAERVRAGTDTDVLRERVRVLSSRHPGRIRARVTVSTENAPDIPNLFSALNSLGSKLEIHLHPFDDSGDTSRCHSTEQRRAFAEDVEGMAHTYPNLSLKPHGFVASPEICPWPWRSPSIKVTGELTPCCRMMYHNDFSWGNVLEQSFDAVWNSESTKNWRAQFVEKSPQVCDGCPWYEMRNDSRT